MYYPHGSTDVIPLSKVRDIAESRTVDYVIEKGDYKDILPEGSTFHSTNGNKVQTALRPNKLGSTMKNMIREIAGFMFQKDSKATREKPTPQLAKPLKGIIVDNDDTGHYVAYWTNAYAYGEPNRKNVYLGNLERGPVSIDLFRANRFWANSILNSRGFDRNRVLANLMVEEDKLGKRGILYRDSQGDQIDLRLSEQDLQIAKIIYKVKNILNVKTADIEIKFDFELESFDEKKPVLFFREIKESLRKLDTDTLLNVSVKKLGISPPTVQALFESLNNSGWITYPRKATVGPDDEPISIIKGKDISQYEGTTNEKIILTLIDNSDKAYSKGESFIKTGSWVLKSGDLELSVVGEVLSSDRLRYTDDEFDISVERAGVDDVELARQLTTLKIATQATRTETLRRLETAGVIIKKNKTYQLDKRGLYLVAGMRAIESSGYRTAIELNKRLQEAKTIDELEKIVDSWDFIDKDKIRDSILIEIKNILEEESDLAYLESF